MVWQGERYIGVIRGGVKKHVSLTTLLFHVDLKLWIHFILNNLSRGKYLKGCNYRLPFVFNKNHLRRRFFTGAFDWNVSCSRSEGGHSSPETVWQDGWASGGGESRNWRDCPQCCQMVYIFLHLRFFSNWKMS